MLKTAETDRLTSDVEIRNHLDLLEACSVPGPPVNYPTVNDASCPRPPWQTALLLLFRIVEAHPVAAEIARLLELEETPSLRWVMESGDLGCAIDGPISPSLSAWVADALGISDDCAHARIVQLSRDAWLLPPKVAEVVHAYVPWADRLPARMLSRFLIEPRLIDRLMLANLEVAAHFDRIRRNARYAEAQLIKTHRLMVASLWRRYAGRGVSHQDLMDAGYEGLVAATAKFDRRRGYSFRTHAAWWIRQAMTRRIAEAGGIGQECIPLEIVQIMTELLRVRRRLRSGSGKEPTIEELAEAMGTSPECIVDIQNFEPDPHGTKLRRRLENLVTTDMAFAVGC